MANTKADAVAAAQQQRKTASDRWTAALPAEARAYENQKSGEQMSRLEYADALDELRGARADTLAADKAVADAAALPDVPAN